MALPFLILYVGRKVGDLLGCGQFWRIHIYFGHSPPLYFTLKLKVPLGVTNSISEMFSLDDDVK